MASARPGLPTSTVEPQVAHRLRTRVDAQPRGIAITGSQLSRARKPVKVGEPQGVVGPAAAGEGTVEHRGDAVGPQVPVPDPVQARQAGVAVEIGAAHQGELTGRAFRGGRPLAGQDPAHIRGFGLRLEAGWF